MRNLSRLIRIIPLSVMASLCLPFAAAHAQDAFVQVVPEDGNCDCEDGTPLGFGVGAAIRGRTAAVSVTEFGVVNIYTADKDRTAWTLQTILRPEDSSPANSQFGAALALQGGHLVIATHSTLRIYAKTPSGFDLKDVVPLQGEFVSRVVTGPVPIDFANGVLAIRTTLTSDFGEGVIHLFRINERGKARHLALLHAPMDPNHSGWSTNGSLSLNADGGALAISEPGAVGRVYIYQPANGTWVLKDTVEQPNSEARSFGASVALRGRKLVVGAPSEGPGRPEEETNTPYSGAVYVYHHQNGHWEQVQRLGTEDNSGPRAGLNAFGAGIATDGDLFVITAPWDGGILSTDNPSGPAQVYRWNGNGLDLVDANAMTTAISGTTLDMSGRYLIAGVQYAPFNTVREWAQIIDLSAYDPALAAQDAGD